MPRSQRHLVEQHGYTSNGEQQAQGAISPDILEAPQQFATGDWSVEDLTTGGDIQISITGLPDEGGAEIFDVEYRLDDGEWTSVTDYAGAGDYVVSGLTDDQEYDVSIRALNETGAGPAAAAKQVTPTTA